MASSSGSSWRIDAPRNRWRRTGLGSVPGGRIMGATCRGGWLAALYAVVASGAVWAAFPEPVVDANGGTTDRPAGAYSGKRHLSASGDFDGDGHLDEAFLLVGDKVITSYGRDRERFMVSLVVSFGSATKKDTVIWQAASDVESVRQIGMKTAGPGTYTPLCKQRGESCEDGVEEVVLNHDGIYYFYFGATASLYYLPEGAKDSEFERLPLASGSVWAEFPEPAVDANGRMTERPAGAWGSYLGKRDLSASGDFDGDGHLDEAFFLVGDKVIVSNGRFRERLTVSLVVSFGSETRKDTVIWQATSDEDVVERMGVKTAGPGTYEDGVDELVLKHDGIHYFYFGATASLYYLPEGAKDGEFKRLQLAD